MTKHCSKRAVGEGENGVVRLFGVRLNDGSFIKKSASMGNILSHDSGTGDSPEGYHSDDPAHGRRAQRKKAIPWTEEEHRQFLVGLQMLGKGDWRGISKNYVPSKTPSQVASHAQKYFIRQNNTSKKKRRSSLFDLVPDLETSPSSMPEQFKVPPLAAAIDSEKLMLSSSQEAEIVNPQLSLDLSLKPIVMPSPIQKWPQASSSCKDVGAGTSHHQILTQNLDIPKEPEKELVGISGLTLGENETVRFELPQLSLRQPLES